jgi:hypothetical protein
MYVNDSAVPARALELVANSSPDLLGARIGLGEDGSLSLFHPSGRGAW